LGCNNLGIYRDSEQTIAVVRKALDVGINFLDMAGEHGGGLEESLVAEALGPRRKDVVIASKFGQADLLALEDAYPVFTEDKARQGAFRRWTMEAATFATADDLSTMEANCRILVRDAEKVIIE
jgi:hypothetical protein